jgi:diguanylate cyclase (GGDEF)-like protein
MSVDESQNIDLDRIRKCFREDIIPLFEKAVTGDLSTYHNDNIPRCHEVLNCKMTACSVYGGEPLRCWQMVGTYCGGTVGGSFVDKYNDCKKCEVFKLSTPTIVEEVGENLNNMLFLLDKHRQEIEKLAITDVLTGIFNRRHLMQRFGEEFDRAARQQKSFGIMLLDIDHFKSVNDKYGHLEGDKVLKEVVLRIKNSIRTYDILARYGGEEFMVILPDTNLESVLSLAERIRHNIKDTPIGNLTVTISIGAAVYRETDKSTDEIIQRVDERLYEAKAAGRDCVKS